MLGSDIENIPLNHVPNIRDLISDWQYVPGMVREYKSEAIFLYRTAEIGNGKIFLFFFQ